MEGQAGIERGKALLEFLLNKLWYEFTTLWYNIIYWTAQEYYISDFEKL